MIKNQNELPTKLVEKIIQYSSNTGDKIMDMFLGGFTTAIASLQQGYISPFFIYIFPLTHQCKSCSNSS